MRQLQQFRGQRILWFWSAMGPFEPMPMMHWQNLRRDWIFQSPILLWHIQLDISIAGFIRLDFNITEKYSMCLWKSIVTRPWRLYNILEISWKDTAMQIYLFMKHVSITKVTHNTWISNIVLLLHRPSSRSCKILIIIYDIYDDW